MRSKIENILYISVSGIDLMTLSDIQFYVRQGSVFFQYAPQVIDSGNMIVTVPLADAKKLVPAVKAELQFAFTDNDGNSGASEITQMVVQDLIKKEGYPDEL